MFQLPNKGLPAALTVNFGQFFFKFILIKLHELLKVGQDDTAVWIKKSICFCTLQCSPPFMLSKQGCGIYRETGKKMQVNVRRMFIFTDSSNRL